MNSEAFLQNLVKSTKWKRGEGGGGGLKKMLYLILQTSPQGWRKLLTWNCMRLGSHYMWIAMYTKDKKELSYRKPFKVNIIQLIKVKMGWFQVGKIRTSVPRNESRTWMCPSAVVKSMSLPSLLNFTTFASEISAPTENISKGPCQSEFHHIRTGAISDW